MTSEESYRLRDRLITQAYEIQLLDRVLALIIDAGEDYDDCMLYVTALLGALETEKERITDALEADSRNNARRLH